MEAQHELAFRTLQNGLNLGKIVMRVAARETKASGNHVVTGGTAGLGLLTGRWLAQRGASRLILASRSGALARDSATEWEAVKATGIDASFAKCDTGEAWQVRSLFASAPTPVHGVWHAAGALADAVLQKQDASGLAFVYAPKAHGAWSLHGATAQGGVRACAFFSSVAALLGMAGQANYAAANTCLDALATTRRARGATATSVQWGAWAEVGMASRGAAGVRLAAMAAAAGFGLIGLAQGMAALSTATRHGAQPVLCLIPMVWSRYLGGTTSVPAFLLTFTPKNKGSGGLAKPSTAEASGGVSLESVLEMVKRTAGGAVDADAPLMESGVDSLGAVELRNQLQSAAGSSITLPSTLVFDFPTARQLASTLQPKQAKAAPATSLKEMQGAQASGAVSIDGTSALFPGGAPSMLTASRLVAGGSVAVTEVPATRWDIHAQPALPEPTASRVRHLGFVRDAELADNVAFAVSPSEAAAMDPCQRLVLERGYSALHDASLDRAALSGSLTGFFLGFAGTEFPQLLAASPAGGSVYAATGSALSIASGRLSYVLGLHGPCVSYDTACSAALVASHSGFRALQLNECVVALVVGTTLHLGPSLGTSFAIAGMTSPRGRCHTFDDRADGYARGEACGATAMRLGRDEAALALLGSAVRQDGRSASLTAPSGQAQEGLVIAALDVGGSLADTLKLAEAHGTGTALGDPIEAGSLVASVLSKRSAESPAMTVGGVKAGIGHGEPAAGMTGLLKLAIGLQRSTAAPNTQLRKLNPLLGNSLSTVTCTLPVELSELSSETEAQGGVSSFGYSGTIAHAVLRSQKTASSPSSPVSTIGSKRRAFLWRELSHPFAQRCMPPSSDGNVVFRSRAAGNLHSLVADHIVQGRVIFPAVGYLEMARAASGSGLHGVYFLQPLAVETPGLLIECAVGDGRFEVRSGEDEDTLTDAAANCSGALATNSYQLIDLASVRAADCERAAHISFNIYDGFAEVGLQYGPGFRTLVQAWGGVAQGAARLQARATTNDGTKVHPADLDDALCASALITSKGGGETRLPFSVESALLQSAPGALWAAVAKENADSVSVRLTTLAGPAQAQLGGFKMRAVRATAEVPTQRHLYVTQWQVDTAEAVSSHAKVLVIGDDPAVKSERLTARASRDELSDKLSSGGWSTVVATAAAQRGELASLPLFALETALMLVQAPAPNVLIITKGALQSDAPEQSGSWGLARVARTEASLPVQCIDAPMELALKLPPSASEPEILTKEKRRMISRLLNADLRALLQEPSISEESHVVTGGTAGLGLLTGRWLAQRGASRLILASRSGALARDSATEWEAVKATGIDASFAKCDTGEAWQVRSLFASAPTPVHGVWHAAGALADAVLQKQDASGLAFVYAPKAHGAWSLHGATAQGGVRACAFFSSVAALLGGAGQANYAAANTCLDALATTRRERGATATSVQWGAWAEVGMASRGAAGVRLAAMAAAAGFGLIGLAQGMAALSTATRHGAQPVLSLVPIVWSRYLGGTTSVPAFLSGFTPARKALSSANMKNAVKTAAAKVTLDDVLEMVKRTAGGAVDADAPLMESGVDSLGAVELRNQLQQAAGDAINLPSTLMFDYPTARQVGVFLQGSDSEQISSTPAAPVHGSPSTASIAQVQVSGLSVNLPVGVASMSALRQANNCGRDLLSIIPAARWDVEQAALDLYGMATEVVSRVRHGGFFRGAELFEHSAFNVSAAEAAAMDPQQRLLLERGYASLYGAGMTKNTLLGSITAVNVGQWASEFGGVLLRSAAGRSVYASTGSSCSVTCGRVSFTLGLQGPCSSYDTACSASLVANHGSVRALQRLECELALSAGVNMILEPSTMRMNAVAGFTSVKGRSHTFDARADGYARGEAIDTIACRLSSENASVLMIGSAVRQDGRSASLTAPSGKAQQGVLLASLNDSQLTGSAIEVLEAHGTGTGLGDPIEAGSVAAVFLKERGAIQLVAGSLKANAGHTEPGAGLAGALKLLVQLCDAFMPPNAQLRVMNPMVNAALQPKAASTLPTQSTKLARASGSPGSGGVSSFGYSGTIAHAVLRGQKSETDPRLSQQPGNSKRRCFEWVDAPHAFLRTRLPAASEGAIVFRSPTAGALTSLVADHAVQGRIIFPGAGYLEMRACCIQLRTTGSVLLAASCC